MSEELPDCDNCGHMQTMHDEHRCYAWSSTCKCTRFAPVPAPSSLRAELAEAKAEIARLNGALAGRDLEQHALRNAITQLSAQRDIVEAAVALAEHHVRQPVTRLAAVHSKDHELCELLDKLVTAVEEGARTDG